MIEVKCPECGELLTVPSCLQGQEELCPGCHSMVTVDSTEQLPVDAFKPKGKSAEADTQSAKSSMKLVDGGRGTITGPSMAMIAKTIRALPEQEDDPFFIISNANQEYPFLQALYQPAQEGFIVELRTAPSSPCRYRMKVTTEQVANLAQRFSCGDTDLNDSIDWMTDWSSVPPYEVCPKCGAEWSFSDPSPLREWTKYHCRRFHVLTVKNSPPSKYAGRTPIPKEVQRQVWRRDEGKCTECGSKENLEFDHIIPLSSGGSNTARNLQLLCEACNRAKAAHAPGDY